MKRKNKIWWRETEYNLVMGKYVSTTYIHPILAITSIIVLAILELYLLFKYFN